MPVKINYLNKASNKSTGNLVLFVDEKFNIENLKKYISNSEYIYIKDLKKNIDNKKKIVLYEVNSKKKIVIVSIKKNINSSEIESLGADFYKKVNYGKNSEYSILSDSIDTKDKIFLGYFLHGFKLKSYEFNKYKTKKEALNIKLNVIGTKNKPSFENQLKFKSLEEGAFYARDLVSEPGNVLHPDEYAKRINSLKKDGLKIKIYDEKKLKKLGMNTLLGVGQGSIRGSYLVTM